jgi:PKD repeat protein
MKLQKYILTCLVFVVAFAIFAMPVSAALNEIDPGEWVFVDEKGLDITNALGGYSKIAWWDPTSNPLTNPPDLWFNVGDPENFDVDSRFYSTVLGEWGTGSWYGTNGGEYTGNVVFNVLYPSATLAILDLTASPTLDVTNGTARIGDLIDFKISSELRQILVQRGEGGEDFDFTIILRNPGGVTYDYLYTPTGANLLTELPLDSYPWYWSSQSSSGSDTDNAWLTNAKDASQNFAYSQGKYSVSIRCNQKGLNFNSATYDITLVPEILDLSIAPTPIVRGNKTYATITGVPNRWYFIWVKDCSGKMTGYECDQPPLIPQIQEDWILFDLYYIWSQSIGDEAFIGSQLFECSGCIKRIYDTVPHYPNEGFQYYALVRMNETGKRTVEWQTSDQTKPGTYIIRAQPFMEETFPDLDTTTRYVEKTLTVNFGVVNFQTFVYGDPNSSAYLGETVRISGTNTDSKTTYLFMTGPCQSCAGSDLMNSGTVSCTNPYSFTAVPVKSDGTWEYIWQTKYLKSDLGQYTIYASSKPTDAPSLEGKPCNDCKALCGSCPAWTKKPFTFYEPTIIADINPKIIKIVCCNPTSIIVNGSATGIMGDLENYYDPVPIGVWIIGENKVAGDKYFFDMTNVDCPGGTFSFDLNDSINTLNLQPGTYSVILQHPMYNHKLDIIPDDWLLTWCAYFRESDWDCYVLNYFGLWDCCGVYTYDNNRDFVVGSSPVRWSKLFVIDGPDRLVGSQASQALINSFQDPTIDDKILVLTFKVESNTALQADFSGSPTTGGSPLQVKFTDISTGAPSSWSWNFGDGGTSDQQNPTYTYLNQGTYDVSLSVSGAGGSSSVTKAGYITVTGVSPTVTSTPVPPSGNTINLYNGWNFVSTAKILADGHNTAGTVFAGVNTAGHSIYLYDAGTGLWQSLGNTSPIVPLDGIWIYSSGTKSVTLTFKNDPLATPPTKQLYEGWNAIGFSDTSAAAAKDALQSVVDEWTSAIAFNAASQSYETSIINGGSGSHSDSNPMYPTKGYWLFMKADGTLAAISA